MTIRVAVCFSPPLLPGQPRHGGLRQVLQHLVGGQGPQVQGPQARSSTGLGDEGVVSNTVRFFPKRSGRTSGGST